MTVDEVIRHLRTLEPVEVELQWKHLVRHLPKSQVGKVIVEVSHLTGSKPLRPLRDALKEAQDGERAAALEAQRLQRVAGRTVLKYQPENRTELARAIEDLIVAHVPLEQYVAFGAQLSRIGVSQIPRSHQIGDPKAPAPAVPRIEPLNDVNVLELVERVAVLEVLKNGWPTPIAVPPPLIKILMQKTQHACPVVQGLVSHPLVLPHGAIVGTDGLNRGSGLYFHGATIAGARPYTQEEARDALARLRAVFLVDFVFRSDLDRDAALAALITGVQRRVLDVAPGVAILAPGQSSGKTTLARRIHLVLTGYDMPVMPFPEGNEEEVSKQLLATLMCSPAAVCFDNLLDGTTFRSGCLAAALTGPQFGKRILGESRIVTCPTNTLFMLTGNNIALGADEVTRWLSVCLSPATERPDLRTFKHPDVVAHALSIREAVLRDVIGVVAGYVVSGASIETRSRFPQWDRMVRQPILWAGGADMADVFTANTDDAEESQAYRGLVRLLHEVFAGEPFTAGAVAQLAVDGQVVRRGRRPAFPGFDDSDGDSGEPLHERVRAILGALRAREPSRPESVGRVLKAAVGRPIDVDGVGLMALTRKTRDGYALYRVEPVS